MKRSLTPLRYPGGKSKLYNYVKDLIIHNNLVGCTYIEAYAGGAGLALKLLEEGIVSKLILNDYDSGIFNLWDNILNNHNELTGLIDTTNITLDEWHNQRNIHNNIESYHPLQVGFSTLFLNRTNFSGIIKAGPLGGQKQTSKYKIDCRFNKNAIIKRIDIINSYRDKIKFYNYDAIEFINRIVSRQKKDCFVFFDPPYYQKGPELYTNFYTHDDHVALSNIIKNVKKPWILTYDNSDAIKEMYIDFNIKTFNLNYSAREKRKGTEIMYYSNNIKSIPFN
jgi:DNA adenine methylase